MWKKNAEKESGSIGGQKKEKDRTVRNQQRNQEDTDEVQSAKYINYHFRGKPKVSSRGSKGKPGRTDHGGEVNNKTRRIKPGKRDRPNAKKLEGQSELATGERKKNQEKKRKRCNRKGKKEQTKSMRATQQRIRKMTVPQRPETAGGGGERQEKPIGYQKGKKKKRRRAKKRKRKA